MKKDMMNYLAPNLDVYEVAVDYGYGNSIPLPGFGSEEDDMVY